MSWINRQNLHDCNLPRGRGFTDGDIWECDDCKTWWKWFDTWAGDGWFKTSREVGEGIACICDGASYYTDEQNRTRHPFLVNKTCRIHGQIMADYGAR